jgi:hypothetical protein
MQWTQHGSEDTMRTDHIAQLVRESLYQVDEHAVAEAILARARARALVAQTEFRNDLRGRAARAREVRSFHPTARARSFHLVDPWRGSPRR